MYTFDAKSQNGVKPSVRGKPTKTGETKYDYDGILLLW